MSNSKSENLIPRLIQVLNSKEAKLEVIDNEKKYIHEGRCRDMSLSVDDVKIAIINRYL